MAEGRAESRADTVGMASQLAGNAIRFGWYTGVNWLVGREARRHGSRPRYKPERPVPSDAELMADLRRLFVEEGERLCGNRRGFTARRPRLRPWKPPGFQFLHDLCCNFRIKIDFRFAAARRMAGIFLLAAAPPVALLSGGELSALSSRSRGLVRRFGCQRCHGVPSFRPRRCSPGLAGAAEAGLFGDGLEGRAAMGLVGRQRRIQTN